MIFTEAPGGVMTCTWKDCDKPAEHSQIANDGEQWANLCQQHHAEMEDSISALDARRTLSNWIKANGGAAAMSKRVMRAERRGGR